MPECFKCCENKKAPDAQYKCTNECCSNFNFESPIVFKEIIVYRETFTEKLREQLKYDFEKLDSDLQNPLENDEKTMQLNLDKIRQTINYIAQIFNLHKRYKTP